MLLLLKIHIPSDHVADEQSLEEFLSNLKKEKVSKKVPCEDEKADDKMLKTFHDNRHGIYSDPISYSSSTSDSDSVSEEYSGKAGNSVDADSSSEESKSGEDVEAGIENIEDKTDAAYYDLGMSFSSKFYSEASLALWPL